VQGRFLKIKRSPAVKPDGRWVADGLKVSVRKNGKKKEEGVEKPKNTP